MKDMNKVDVALGGSGGQQDLVRPARVVVHSSEVAEKAKYSNFWF
jgi:hypothetical protein